MSTARQKVIAGEKPSDSKKTGLLNEAVDKIKNLGGRIERAKEVTESIAEAMISTAETQGTVFAASFVEGYLGEEKVAANAERFGGKCGERPGAGEEGRTPATRPAGPTPSR